MSKATAMEILFASNNPHKLEEAQAILGPSFQVVSPASRGLRGDLPETCDTLRGNSVQKASAVWNHFQADCFADDTGLEIDALGGAPGVHSARYAGVHGEDGANNALLLRNLDALGPKAPRTCHFSCALALVAPDGREFVALGQCPGTLLREGRGMNGFGYDPLFLPDGWDRTFAELPREVKCTFSHRARAAERMRPLLRSLFPAVAS